MNHFVHRMLGHYLQNEAEEGADLGGGQGGQEAALEEGEQDADEGGEQEDDEVVVTLGDEPVSEPSEEEKGAPQWVKDLRKQHREAQKRVRELEQQVAAAKAPAAPAEIEVGPKPNLSDDDIDYDQDKYDQKVFAWLERKRKAEQQVEEQQRAQRDAEEAWQAKLSGYQAQKASLKLPDYEEAEDAIRGLMDVTQQGVILQGADNPALVIYALGKNEAKAKELAAIKDPVKFAFAVAKLETQVKMQKRDKPAPERVVNGTAPKSGAIDSTLERLRAEAEKTGDMSKVLAYKRQQKAKERA